MNKNNTYEQEYYENFVTKEYSKILIDNNTEKILEDSDIEEITNELKYFLNQNLLSWSLTLFGDNKAINYENELRLNLSEFSSLIDSLEYKFNNEFPIIIPEIIKYNDLYNNIIKNTNTNFFCNDINY